MIFQAKIKANFVLSLELGPRSIDDQRPGAGSSIWKWALGSAVQLCRIVWNMGPLWTGSYLAGLSLASGLFSSAGRDTVEGFFAAVADGREPIWAAIFENPDAKSICYRPLGGVVRTLVTPGEWWADNCHGATILRVEEAIIRGGGRYFSSTFAMASSGEGGGERAAFARFEISDESEHNKLSRVDFFW